MSERIKGFAPIAFEDSEVLLLGTLPGVESLQKNYYYADKTNYFWDFFVNMQDIISPKVMRKL